MGRLRAWCTFLGEGRTGEVGVVVFAFLDIYILVSRYDMK